MRGPPVARQESSERLGGRQGPQDPYRWLEGETPEVRAWVDAQLQWSQLQLVDRPGHRVLLEQFQRLLRQPRRGMVQEAGGSFFHRTRGGDAEHWSLSVSATLDGPRRTIIDVEQFFGADAPALADCHPSPDGRFVAFRVSFKGSSFMPLHVVDVATGELLADHVPADLNPVAHQWHSTNLVAWSRSGSSFFYSRAPMGSSAEVARYRQRIFHHRLGRSASEDDLVFGDELADGQLPTPRIAPDGRHLLVVAHDFTGDQSASAAWIGSCEVGGARMQGLFPFRPGTITAALTDTWAYFSTTRADTVGGIFRLPLSAVPGEPEVVMEEPLAQGRLWTVVGDCVVAESTDPEGVAELRATRRGGKEVRRVALDGSLHWLSATSDGKSVLAGVSDPQHPPHAVRIDLWGATAVAAPSGRTRMAQLEVRRFRFPSADGTLVPIRVVCRRDFVPGANSPAVVRGYGGFGKSMRPTFRTDILPFLHRGGVYAEACVRGGGELGEAWHRAGMRERKQNCFDDFNAAGEWLVEQGFAGQGRLGAMGWSNGGLLTMVAALQRPALWRAVVAGAPVADMARFHLSHNGRHWTSEYGSPEQQDELEWLLRYSPYHNMPESIDAPAILIFAPDADDRVAPWHGRKMLAQWQRASTSGRPVLLRAGRDVGHGGGSSVSRMAQRHADIWAFFHWQLGLEAEGEQQATQAVP
jgi:prolyl oligopeptidase